MLRRSVLLAAAASVLCAAAERVDALPAAAASAGAPSSRGASAGPVISHVSSGRAAAPNETLVLAGVGLSGASARLCPLRGGGACLVLPPQPSSWDGGLKVTLPADGRGVGAFSLSACAPDGACSNDTQAQRWTVNAPRVRWVLGDDSTAAGTVAAGGMLRVFGSALALSASTGVCAPILADSAALPAGALPPSWAPGAVLARTSAPAGTSTRLSLCGGGGGCTALPPPALASCHRLDVLIPAGTPAGAYALRVDNGLADTRDGAGVLDAEFALAVLAAPVWPAAELVVGTDCDVATCVARAAAAGGATVRVPPGVFDVGSNVVLSLDNATTLVGAGAGASTLRWAANTAAGAPPAALSCRGRARVAGLTLLATSPVVAALGFSGAGCAADALNITIALAGSNFSIGPAFAASGARAWRLTNSLLVHAGACTRSWPHNTAYTVWGCADGLFANNSVWSYCQGHSTDSSQRIAFDGNAVWSLGADSQGSGFATFESPQVLEHIYVGRSVDVGNPGAAKRWESMTLDGPGGATFATFAALSSDGTDGAPQTLTLAAPARSPGPYPGGGNVSAYLGGSVAVLFGPGLGGMSRVAAITPLDGNWSRALVVTLDPPLLTRPVPGVSYLAINPYRGHMVFEADSYVNDTTWQLWAQATDVILAGSVFQNISGDIRDWSLQYQCPWESAFSCAWQPNVAVDMMHNTLRCAHAMNAISSDYGAVPPVNLTLNIGLTRRGNTLLGGTSMLASGRTADVLVEGTVLGPAECDGAVLPAGDINIDAAYALVR